MSGVWPLFRGVQGGRVFDPCKQRKTLHSEQHGEKDLLWSLAAGFGGIGGGPRAGESALMRGLCEISHLKGLLVGRLRRCGA